MKNSLISICALTFLFSLYARAQATSLSTALKWSISNQVVPLLEVVQMKTGAERETTCVSIGELNGNIAYNYSMSVGSYFNKEVPKDVWNTMTELLDAAERLKSYCLNSSSNFGNKKYLDEQILNFKESHKKSIDVVNKFIP